MSAGLDPRAHAAALAGLARMTPPRLFALLSQLSPAAAWAAVAGVDGAKLPAAMAPLLRAERLREDWYDAARRTDPAEVWERCVRSGIDVTYLGEPRHPVAASTDPLPAAVLFHRGDLGLLAGRRVAIVGTRNATPAGRRLARRLGRGLAAAGVHVVSGLARGIDGQSHGGVLDRLHERDGLDGSARCGRPIGVVASGLDRVYPPEHADLWERVATDGLLLTESPPGTPPTAYRFPLRNRLVAGLSEIVVVVESRERGGSLITADLAAARGITVMAVPGSPHARSSSGANELLRDGAGPVLDVDDVLHALSLDHAAVGVPAERRPRPRPADLVLLDVCRERPRTLGDVAAAACIGMIEAAMGLARLEQTGWVVQSDGWFQGVGSPPT
jgi:DNA processing protein